MSFSESLPNHERRRWFPSGKLGWTLGFTSAVALAGGSAIATEHPDAIADTWYFATGQQTVVEEALQNALNSALDIDVRVRCTDIPDDIQEKHSDIATGIAGYVSRTGPGSRIRLAPWVCEGISTVIDRVELFEEQQLGAAAYSLFLSTHDGEHVAEDTLVESAVQCYATQEAPTVARALGASEAVAHQLGAHIMDKVDEWYPAGAYRVPAQCQDGSELDLQPNLPGGYFPDRSLNFPVHE